VSLRAAVIGYGLAGRVFHAPLIAAVEGLEVCAIVTGDAARAAQARAEHPAATILASADELWRDPGLVDFVVIAAPNRVHTALAMAALQCGLPVAIDKPAATSSDDIKLLIDESDRVAIPLTVFQNRRWDSDFLTARALVEGGELGTVTRFESRFERRPSDVVPAADAWRELGDPAEGGGLLFDLGTHLIDQALVLFGDPIGVYAELERRAPDAVVDDDSFVALSFASGVHAHLWMSKVAPSPGPRLRVVGLRATYEHPGLDPQEAALAAGGRPGDAGWGVAEPEHWGRLVGPNGARQLEPEAGAYERFYKQFRDALLGRGTVPVDPGDALATQMVIEAAHRSARTRELVPCKERNQ
jgi:predicted dehydrogenase